MRHCQLVMGPAGTGKSTYCKSIYDHCCATKRVVHIVNLDPAAEEFEYPVAFDIRDLISLEDAMEEMDFGPNGGLVFCMEYLLENLDWLKEELESYGDDDYLIFDCPGQIELYSHLPVMKTVAEMLQTWGFHVCGVYLIDSLFIADPSKFFSGVLTSLSTMVKLEIPFVNVLTKVDLVDEGDIERYLDPSGGSLMADVMRMVDSGRLNRLTAAICELVEDFNMVTFLPMNRDDEESIEYVLLQVDSAIQYGEDVEPKDPDEEAMERLYEMQNGQQGVME